FSFSAARLTLPNRSKTALRARRNLVPAPVFRVIASPRILCFSISNLHVNPPCSSVAFGAPTENRVKTVLQRERGFSYKARSRAVLEQEPRGTEPALSDQAKRGSRMVSPVLPEQASSRGTGGPPVLSRAKRGRSTWLLVFSFTASQPHPPRLASRVLARAP